MNVFANEYLGITVSVLMLNMFSRSVPTEIQMHNITSLGNITKAADSEVGNSPLPGSIMEEE